MTDGTPPGPVPDDHENPVAPVTDDAEDAAYRERMAELFEDIPEEETPEEINADRDSLRKKLIEMGASLSGSRQDNTALTKQLTAQKEELAQSMARIKNQFDAQASFALEKFVKEVLPVIDNLERGLGAIPKAQRAADPKFDKLAQGIEKTIGQLTAVFNKFGIREINPRGEAFDPARHEAISTQDAPDVESDTVVEVAQKGYELNGRVIRPAKVIVKP